MTRRIALALVALWIAGCVLPGAPPPGEGALRIGDLAADGDPMRRASLELVVEALDTEAAGGGRRASGLYARALQIDSSNPYAYLALARHHLEHGDARLALQHLERAEGLLRSTDALSPRALVHVLGLRGSALRRTGDDLEGTALVERAAAMAPDVWGDGELAAAELR